MKTITSLALTALLITCGGCATAGTEFIRPSSESLALGKTTPLEILNRLGKPYHEATNIQEGKMIKTLVYSYAKAAVFVEEVPSKAMRVPFF